MYKHLFSEIEISGIGLKNRLTMAPLYLGYAGEGGTVSTLVKRGKENEIIKSDPGWDHTCMKLVMKKKPAFCVRWPHGKMKEWKARLEEDT